MLSEDGHIYPIRYYISDWKIVSVEEYNRRNAKDSQANDCSSDKNLIRSEDTNLSNDRDGRRRVGELNHAGEGDVCLGVRHGQNNGACSYECSSRSTRAAVNTNLIRSEDTNLSKARGKDLHLSKVDITLEKAKTRRKSRWKNITGIRRCESNNVNAMIMAQSVRKSKVNVLLQDQHNIVLLTQSSLETIEVKVGKKSWCTTLDYQRLLNAQVENNNEMEKLRKLADYEKVSSKHRFMRSRSNKPEQTSRPKRKRKKRCNFEDDALVLSTISCGTIDDSEDSDYEYEEEEEDEDEYPNKSQKNVRCKALKDKDISSVHGTQRFTGKSALGGNRIIDTFGTYLGMQIQQQPHHWVYDLKTLDGEKERFDSKSLVVIRGGTDEIAQKTWLELIQNPDLLRDNVSKVILIPRCMEGQLYLCGGLQSSLHFSLGQKASIEMVKHLQSACKIDVYVGGTPQQYWSKAGISLKKLAGFDIDSIYVSNIDTSQHLHKRTVELMTAMGSHLWSTLFSVSYVTELLFILYILFGAFF